MSKHLLRYARTRDGKCTHIHKHAHTHTRTHTHTHARTHTHTLSRAAGEYANHEEVKQQQQQQEGKEGGGPGEAKDEGQGGQQPSEDERRAPQPRTQPAASLARGSSRCLRVGCVGVGVGGDGWMCGRGCWAGLVTGVLVCACVSRCDCACVALRVTLCVSQSIRSVSVNIMQKVRVL